MAPHPSSVAQHSTWFTVFAVVVVVVVVVVVLVLHPYTVDDFNAWFTLVRWSSPSDVGVCLLAGRATSLRWAGGRG